MGKFNAFLVGMGSVDAGGITVLRNAKHQMPLGNDGLIAIWTDQSYLDVRRALGNELGIDSPIVVPIDVNAFGQVEGLSENWKEFLKFSSIKAA